MDKSCGNCLYSDSFFKCPEKKVDHVCNCWKYDGFDEESYNG